MLHQCDQVATNPGWDVAVGMQTVIVSGSFRNLLLGPFNCCLEWTGLFENFKTLFNPPQSH